MRILAIESSCDETSVAIVEDGKKVLCNVVYTQIEVHKLYGGVVPEVASRRHIEKITYVIIGDEMNSYFSAGTIKLNTKVGV